MFYYTNFVQETNVWWLRRVRPLWVGATLLWCYFMFHRYYFFGKWAAKNQRSHSVEENMRRAQANKRYHGFVPMYQPTLERSRKRQIMELLGKDYDQAVAFEDRMTSFGTMEELQASIDAENDY